MPTKPVANQQVSGKCKNRVPYSLAKNVVRLQRSHGHFKKTGTHLAHEVTAIASPQVRGCEGLTPGLGRCDAQPDASVLSKRGGHARQAPNMPRHTIFQGGHLVRCQRRPPCDPCKRAWTEGQANAVGTQCITHKYAMRVLLMRRLPVWSNPFLLHGGIMALDPIAPGMAGPEIFSDQR